MEKIDRYECTKIKNISGVKEQSSLGVGKMFHDLLRRIYRKIGYDHPALMSQYSLREPVRAMNDKIGEADLVSSKLVLGYSKNFQPSALTYHSRMKEWKLLKQPKLR